MNSIYPYHTGSGTAYRKLSLLSKWQRHPVTVVASAGPNDGTGTFREKLRVGAVTSRRSCDRSESHFCSFCNVMQIPF